MKHYTLFCLVITLVSAAGMSLTCTPTVKHQTSNEISQTPARVTVETLLNEMVDRRNLARLSEPDYTCRQFSSYDRHAVAPDEPGWYANLDRTYFVRTEQNQGRTEYVMFDAAGPGAIVRFWSTWYEGGKPTFSNGTLRFYLDGSDKPTIENGIADILSGHQLVGPPLSHSVSPETAYNRRGHNLYFPIPYAKHCKITYESPEITEMGGATGEALYYQINYRTYGNETQVESFTPEVLQRAHPILEKIQAKLAQYERGDLSGLKQERFSGTLAPGEERAFRLRGPGAVRELAFNIHAEDIEQALRSTILEISFDDNQTVWCPIGDFFGAGHKINPYRSWYTAVTEDGLMSCYWIMPFERSARFSLHNLGEQSVEVAQGDIRYGDWNWDERSLYFHANWKNYHALSTGKELNSTGNRAFDINYIDIKGRGKYVGDSLTLFNGTAGWWGEGDEKIYIDGAPGDRLILEFETDRAGQLNLEAVLTKAPDYGIVKIDINGSTALESLDLYNQGVIAVPVELGPCHINKGVNQMEITIIGANEAAIKRHMFGLDYLKIN